MTGYKNKRDKLKTDLSRKNQNKMKKHFAILTMTILTLAFLSFTNSNSKVINLQTSLLNTINLISFEKQNDSLDKIVQTIIDICANAYFKHQKPAPGGFRNVVLKTIKKDNGEELYVICGQFLMLQTQKKDEWTQFATIKNSHYEQWVVANASIFCRDSEEVDYRKIKLLAALKSQFYSLQKGQK